MEQEQEQKEAVLVLLPYGILGAERFDQLPNEPPYLHSIVLMPLGMLGNSSYVVHFVTEEILEENPSLLEWRSSMLLSNVRCETPVCNTH